MKPPRSRSRSRFTPTIDAPEIRALFAREFSINHIEFANMTKAEKKTYLEGLKRINDKEREQQTGRKRPKGQPRQSDIDMAQNLEADLAKQQSAR